MANLKFFVFVLVYVVCLPIFPGCSSTEFIGTSNQNESQELLSIEKFNNEIGSRSVTLTLKNGTKLDATNVRLQADSTMFEESEYRNKIMIPTDSISQFRITNKFSGALEGMFFGAVVAGTTPAIFEPTFLQFDKKGFTVLHGAIIGGAAGLMVGLIAGDATVYKFKVNSK